MPMKVKPVVCSLQVEAFTGALKGCRLRVPPFVIYLFDRA